MADFRIVRHLAGAGTAPHYYHVEFRPTAAEVGILGQSGLHSNDFYIARSKPVDFAAEAERCIRGYWERKLRAAAEGRPYPQHHRTTLNIAVAASADDARERQDNTNFDSTIDTLQVRSNSTGPTVRWDSGVRFQNVTIPAGSTINSCTITINVTGGGTTDDARLDLYLNDVDDASDFTTEADVVDRIRTTASSFWDQSNMGTGLKTSPDFAAALQEIIDRPGWASGQAVCVLMIGRASGTDRTLQFEAYDNVGTNPAEIDIDYTPAGAADPFRANPMVLISRRGR